MAEYFLIFQSWSAIYLFMVGSETILSDRLMNKYIADQEWKIRKYSLSPKPQKFITPLDYFSSPGEWLNISWFFTLDQRYIYSWVGRKELHLSIGGEYLSLLENIVTHDNIYLQIPFVMLRHDTPPALLSKFLSVFNVMFTRTLAKETYISKLSAFRQQVVSKFTTKEDKDTFFDVKNNLTMFKAKLTAEKLKNRLQLSGGSSNR